jgi:hypothetical protein
MPGENGSFRLRGEKNRNGSQAAGFSLGPTRTT